MKIVLTKTEVINTIKLHYNLPDTFELKIVDVIIPYNIQKAVAHIDQIGIRGDNKISCIRTFRDYFIDSNKQNTVGLADAKWIIENWQKAKDYINAYGRLPKDCYPNGPK